MIFKVQKNEWKVLLLKFNKHVHRKRQFELIVSRPLEL